MPTEIPEHWKNREVIRASESPTLARKKSERLAARKASILRDVKRGARPAEDLDKFNDELRREQEREERRVLRDEALDLVKERILNEQRDEDIRRAAERELAAEEGR